MAEAFESIKMPKICYVFGELSGGGHNLQAFKTIIYSGAASNCIAVSIFKNRDESLADLLIKNGIPLIKLDLNNKELLLRGKKKLRQIVLENGCNIVHSNGLKADTLCHFAFRNTNVQHIITLHNYLREDVFLRKGKLYSFVALSVQSYVLARTKYVIACSKTLQKQMLRDNSKLNVSVIQNGVDTDFFSPRDRQKLRIENGVDSDSLIFISTGRMSPRKRITETADSFIQADLEKKHQLWFVGSGECYEEYRRKYLQYKNIRFLGRREDIPDLLNIADIFVSSSETEGLPLAVLEALATGKKVFLSDIPQHKEILESFPSGGALYHLGNEAELAALFKKAHAYCVGTEQTPLKGTNFDIQVMGAEYAQYYRKVQMETLTSSAKA